MMQKLLAICVLVACGLYAQTTVYLRDDTTPAPKKITNITEGAGVLVVTATGHGLSNSDKVHVSGIRGCWRANGTRTVVSVPDANTVHLRPRDGVSELNCGGTYTAQGTSTKEYYLAKLTSYSLKGNPNIGGFDGPGGTFTTSFAARATGSNPAWLALKARADVVAGTYTGTDLDEYSMHSAAMAWFVEGGASRLAAAKKWLNNLHLSQYGTHSGCSTTTANCGRYTAFDQISLPIAAMNLTFSLIHDQLTSDERNAFLQKMLNDKRLDNDTGSDCTNPYTTGAGTVAVTNGSNTVTISPAAGAEALTVGDLFTYTTSGADNLLEKTLTVTSVDSMTGVVTLSGTANHTLAAQKWLYVSGYPTWNSSSCGWTWQSKHNVENPPIFGPYDGTVGYPTTGGQGGYPNENHLLWRMRAYMETGAVTCQYDVRGCELYERAQAYFYDQIRVMSKNMWAGLTNVGGGAYRGRGENQVATIAVGMKAQLSPSLDVTGGNYLKENLIWSIFQLLPGTTTHLHTYGETSQPQLSAYSSQHTYSTQAAAAGTTEGAYHRYWLQNSWWNWTQSELAATSAAAAPLAMMGVDLSLTATDYRSVLKTQRLWWNSDISADWLGNTAKSTLLGMASRTSWSSGTATSLFSAPLGTFNDHSYFKSIGHYQIWKGRWLYANTGNCTVGSYMTGSSAACFTGYADMDSHVEIGRPASTATTYEPYLSGLPSFASFTAAADTGVQLRRWAGSTLAGRSEEDYAYFAWDLDKAVNASVMGVTPTYQRYHLLHLKKGGRDYVLRYVSTALPSAKAMRTYLQFPNNGQTDEGYTSADTDGIIRTATTQNSSMHTKVLVPTSLSQTDLHVSRTSATVLTLNAQASVSYPVRHQMGGVSCSFTAPVAVTRTTFQGTLYLYIKPSDCTLHARYNTTSGVAPTFGAGITDDATTGWPASDFYAIVRWGAGSSGWFSTSYPSDSTGMQQIDNTRRFVVDLTPSTTGVGSATSSEYLVIHDIHGNTSDSATTVTQTDSTNWRTVQFAHATLSAVAAFSKADSCYESWSFTSTHAGTAQYALLGLCQGNYSAQRGADTPLTFSVTNGDETGTFDGIASSPSAWAVTRTGAGPTIATESFPAGETTVAYSQLLAGVCSDSPCAWAVQSGALPTSLSLNASTGEISGTPSATGTFNFTIRYTDDSALYTDRAFSIVITEATQPLNLADFLVDCTFPAGCSATLQATGGTSPYTYAYTGSLPSGVTLASDGTISGIPSQPGDFDITVTATDDDTTEVTANGRVRVNTAQGAADFTLRRSVCSATSCVLTVSLSGFDANTIIYGVLRGPGTQAEVARFEFPKGPATRDVVVENLTPSTTYQLQVIGATSALNSPVTTAASSSTSASVIYQVAAATVAGTTHLRLRYGGASSLGSTSSVTACADGACSITLTRDGGPLWIADDRCSDGACSTVLASHPAQPYMVQ